MLFPRFRSKERDLRSDIERLSIIQASVTRAIGEAESELAGLLNRLDDARARAAFLYGDVIDGEVDANEKNSALINEAERILVRGEMRREELEAHFAVLRDLHQRLVVAIEGLAADQLKE